MNFDDLRSRVTGTVLERGSDGFAEEVAANNLVIVHDPDVAVGVATAGDVEQVVRFARENGIPLAVQATGHGQFAPVTEGILVTTKRLDNVTIDPDSRIATVGAGARWKHVAAAAAGRGLMPVSGASPSVGTVGYLLGGGLGPLSRSHGFSSDWARSFSVVTADGETISASADENPDLFWALRGGKGGLGIVTELRVELAPLASVYAGDLFFDTPDIETAFRAWVDWTATAPENVTTSVALMRFPPLDFVPAPFRGRTLLALRFAYPGGAADGAPHAEALRSIAPVYLDTIADLPTSELGRIHNDPDAPGMSWDRGMLLRSIDQDFATALLAHVGAGVATPFIVAEIRHLGGRTKVDVPEGSAVGGRNSDFTFFLLGVDPTAFEQELPAAADAIVRDVADWVSPETTINFAGATRTEQEFEAAWPPATFSRLAEVRTKFDPTGFFAYGPLGR